jgi:hypothetical protein
MKKLLTSLPSLYHPKSVRYQKNKYELIFVWIDELVGLVDHKLKKQVKTKFYKQRNILKFETEASLNWMELEKNKTYLKIEKAFRGVVSIWRARQNYKRHKEAKEQEK